MQHPFSFSPSRALPRPQQARTAGKIYRSTWKLSDKEVEAYCGIYGDEDSDSEYEALVALAEKEGEEEEEDFSAEVDWYNACFDQMEALSESFSRSRHIRSPSLAESSMEDLSGPPLTGSLKELEKQGKRYFEKEAKHRRKVRDAINALGEQVQDLWIKFGSTEKRNDVEEEGAEGGERRKVKRKAQDDETFERSKKLRFTFEISWSGFSVSARTGGVED